MVDPLGSAASATALFQFCIQAFNFVQDIRHHDAELRKLSIRLSIEKCRLYTWGESVGLTQIYTTHIVLSAQETSMAVGSLIEISQSFDDFQIRAGTPKLGVKLLKKTYWAIYDKKKFKSMISEAKELIDGIQDITKDIANVDSREKTVAYRLQHMKSISSLEEVADVCKNDYPTISDALTYRAELLSRPSTRQNLITDWSNCIEYRDEGDKRDLCIAAIENMTVTELKHSLASLLYRRGSPITEPGAFMNSDQEVILYENRDSDRSQADELEKLLSGIDLIPISSSSTTDQRDQGLGMGIPGEIASNTDIIKSCTTQAQDFNHLTRDSSLSTALMDTMLASRSLQLYPREFLNEKVRFWEPELKRIIQVELNGQDFNPENDAMAEWFETLTDDEKNAVVLRLSGHLNSTQTLFLSAILNRKADWLVDHFNGKESKGDGTVLQSLEIDQDNSRTSDEDEEELRLTF